MKKKKAVIFDLWDTLVFKNGKNITASIAEYYGLTYDAVYEWIELSSLAKDTSDKYYYIKIICQANAINFKDEDKIFFDNLIDNYDKECDWVEGAKETLSLLKAKEYKIGILSNTSEIAYCIIEKFKLKEYVDQIVLSCETGYLKPDPRIFQNILDKLCLTEDETIMAGDTITTDVLGAKAIGMDVIYFNKDEKENNLNPNLSFIAIINKLLAIINILDKLENEA